MAVNLTSTLDTIKEQQLPNGGFPYHAGEHARPDATAWAIIALSVFETGLEQCARAQEYLISQQAKDGYISISPEHPQASWPTPLAILAWSNAPFAQQAHDLAVHFLLDFSGPSF